MFKRILVPISSEQTVPSSALRRACELSLTFQSEVYVLYVIEQRRLQQLDEISEHILTYQHLDKLKKNIKEARIRDTKGQTFESIDRCCAEQCVESKNMVTIGRYSNEILKAVAKHDIELIVLEFIRSFLINFEIFEKSPVPVWVEGVD